MKSVFLFLACAMVAPAAFAQQPRNVQAASAAATRDQITADLKFGTGRTQSFLAGSALALAGTLSGAPTGGTLNLAAVTLTLPATVSGGTSSFQPASSNLTSFATVTPSANGLSYVSAANYAAMRTLLGVTTGNTTTNAAAAAVELRDSYNSALPALSYNSDNGTWTITDGSAFASGMGLAAIATSGSAASIESGTLGVTYGGTGASTYTKGDLLTTPGAAVLNKLAVGTNGQVLTANSTATNGVAWESVSGTGNVTGASLTANAVIVGAGSTAIAPLASLGTSGQPLVSAGAGAPPAFGTLGVAGGGTGLTSGTSGGIPYYSGSSAITSSGVLATNNTVVGGGAGGAPVTRPVTIDASGNIVTAGNVTGNVVVATTLTVADLTTTNLTISGTISGVVGVANGGTGASTYTKGDLLVTPGAAVLNKLAVGTNGQVLTANSSATNGVNWATISGSGTVTSVALTVPTGFSVTGSPITGSGTLAISTTLSGVLKGDGSGIVAATAGTDYVAPGGALGTPSSGTLTNATGLPVAGITSSTSTALGVGSLEVGHASDTTLARSAAGVLTVEGVVLPSISSTNTLTNKRLTARITSITSSGTPTINTDNCDAVTITALAAAITSMTTNLSGTPDNFDQLLFRIKDDGTARAITWGASFAARGATLPTTTVISKVLYALFIWNSVTSTWDCVSTAQEA